MNYYYNPPQNPLDEIKRFFRQGSALSVLIIINVAFWAVVQVLKVIVFFSNNPDGDALNSMLLHVMALPAWVPALVAKPWTLVTYMFFQIDLWHILFNMLWLYWFGRIFREFLSSRQLVMVYLLGGIAGGLVYVIAFNVFPVFSRMLQVSFALGASASVMAIVTAISVFVPNYTIQLLLLGRLKIIYLAAILFIFDFFMIPSGNSGGHIAHIGGALFGALYILLFRLIKAPRQGQKIPGFLDDLLRRFNRKRHSGKATNGDFGRPVSDEEYNMKKKENQDRIDTILEKISKGGYDSLTKEEKEFLFKTSNKR
jgi:membrane associated rhomboid family serine protease